MSARTSLGRAALVAVAVIVALAMPGCALLVGDGGGYRLVAYFPQAVALYPHGDVTLMGVGIGTVDAVKIEHTRVRVEMTIRDHVPLPADVNATIAPLTLVGERNVVLYPPWTEEMAAEGRAQAEDGDEIPMERTQVPVEPDEALKAFNDLASALDPDAVRQLVSNGARALEGQGASINAALEETASLTSTLAAIDTQLLDVADSVHRLAASLNTREQQLGAVIDSFSVATGVLAAERDGIAAFLDSLVRLSREGESLVGAYRGTLPGDVATLTRLVMTLDTNTPSVEQLLAAFPVITQGLLDAYDPSRTSLIIRVPITPSVAAVLAPIFELLGVPVPCIPLLGDIACPSGTGG